MRDRWAPEAAGSEAISALQSCAPDGGGADLPGRAPSRSPAANGSCHGSANQRRRRRERGVRSWAGESQQPHAGYPRCFPAHVPGWKEAGSASAPQDALGTPAAQSWETASRQPRRRGPRNGEGAPNKAAGDGPSVSASACYRSSKLPVTHRRRRWPMTYATGVRVGARARLGVGGIGQRWRLLRPPEAEGRGAGPGGAEPGRGVPSTRGRLGRATGSFLGEKKNPNVTLRVDAQEDHRGCA
nr:LOW QUALITY PROTEIN: uncharacterized protein LOC111755986 [Cavia porcellus]